MQCFVARTDDATRNLSAVAKNDFDTWLKEQPERIRIWLDGMGVKAKAGVVSALPDEQGAPGGFLLFAEAAVVGGGGVQVARLQAAPQGLLMAARAERWTHHIAGSGLPVGVAVHAVV